MAKKNRIIKNKKVDSRTISSKRNLIIAIIAILAIESADVEPCLAVGIGVPLVQCDLADADAI
jgi:hypothetical protein